MIMSQASKLAHEKIFLETIDKVDAIFGQNAFRQIDEHGKFANQVNRAIYDVVMLTFAHVQKASLIEKKAEIIHELMTLCTTDEGFKDAIGRATRDKARINTRVRLWRDRLADLGLQCPVLAYGE